MRRKITAALLAALLLFSMALPALHMLRGCEGRDCPVCECMALFKSAVAGCACMLCLRLAARDGAIIAGGCGRFFAALTPVQSRVRLND